MAAPSTPPNLDQGWAPEPELREPAPRRIEPVFDYPDLNKPNVMVFSATGGALAAVGVILFILGLAQHQHLLTLLGLVLAAAGAALLILFPAKARTHDERARHLIENGLPIMANVLTSENLTGDSTYGRAVKYQVALPGGEVVNRSINADERRLPKSIPGKATALVDMNSGDVELYCALPFRAAVRPAPVVPVPHAAPAVGAPVTAGTLPASVVNSVPVGTATEDPFASIPLTAPPAAPANSGGMGTLGTIGAPAATAPRPAAPAAPPPVAPVPEQPAAPAPQEPETAPPASDKLPWE